MRVFSSCFSSFSGKLIWKMSPIVLGQILNVFVNTLIAADEYPVQDGGNFSLPILMKIPEKRKAFSHFLVPFLESRSNFKYFEKKDDCHS